MQRLALSAVFCLTTATVAHAACTAPPPGVTRIEGVVRAAVNGDTVCIQTSPDHLDLTRVRLAEVHAPQLDGPGGEGAKWALRRAARGKAVVCALSANDAGICRTGGVSLAEILKAKGR